MATSLRTRSKALLASVAVGAGALALAAGAHGAAGDLTYADCISEGGFDNCAAVNTFEFIQDAAISFSGGDVYAVAEGDNAINHFRRAADGSLTFAGCYANHALTGCTDIGPDVLSGVSAISTPLSSTGVYVTSRFSDAVVAFDRDFATGGLTYLNCYSDGGAGGCQDPGPDSLDGVNELVAQSRSVYAVSPVTDSVTRFSLASVSDALVAGGCFADGGANGCVAVNSLDGATGVTADLNADNVYVTSVGDDSVTRFARAADGALTPAECIAEAGAAGCTDPSIDSLVDPVDVATSASGSSVYVASKGDDAITHFTKPGGGPMAFDSCLADAGAGGCVDPPIDSLDDAAGVAVSWQDHEVYAGASGDHAVTQFTRDGSGDLQFRSCVAESGGSGCTAPPKNSLRGASDVIVSPDDANLYAVGTSDESLSIFSFAGTGVGGGGGGDTTPPPTMPPAGNAVCEQAKAKLAKAKAKLKKLKQQDAPSEKIAKAKKKVKKAKKAVKNAC